MDVLINVVSHHAFSFILIMMACALYLERRYPHYELPEVEGWTWKSVVFSSVQLFASVFGKFIWEPYLTDYHIFDLKSHLGHLAGGLFGYIFSAWFFYWWHLLRHEVKPIWKLIHQFHHSPTRIEIMASLYKHPLEIISNSIIMTIIAYPLLGLSLESTMWMNIWLAFGEFLYHINVKTPYWLGFIIQRPESHRLHHLRNNRICQNYGDIPFLDILGGTFKNPKPDAYHPVGFSDKAELRIGDLLLAKDVMPKNKVKHKEQIHKPNSIILYILLFLGCLNTIGFAVNSPTIKGLAFSTAASPLPLVFTVYNGMETFSTDFQMHARFQNGTNMTMHIDKKLYGKLQGPYNRRNVFGAVFSYGAYFSDPNIIKLRDQVLQYGFCGSAPVAKEFGFSDPLKQVTIRITSKTKGLENKEWFIDTICL
jgi:sterol desaturase/sphingolipid hydroxylase (fatty acid hydroxylase superfamily)